MVRTYLLIFVFIIPHISFSQLFCNTGFEERTTDGSAKYWQSFPASPGCTITIDSTVSYHGKYCVKIDHQFSSRPDSTSYILATINTSRVSHIKKIVVTAWVKTDVLNDSDVFIVLNDDSRALYSQCFAEPNPGGHRSQWRRLTLTRELNEPEKVWQIYIAACARNKAVAWFDSFSVTIDGKNIAEKPVLKFTQYDKNWLNENSFGSNQTPDANFYNQISKIVGKKYLLAVGEPTHGTHEAYLFKIKLFKYLVEHEQYRVIALENGMAETYVLDRYIEGEYPPEASFSKEEYRKYLNSFLYTNEMIDFIEWMRTYNQSHTEKIHCIGLDVQTFEQSISNARVLTSQLGIQNFTAELDSIDGAIQRLRLQNFDNSTTRQGILKQVQMLADSCKAHLQDFDQQGAAVNWLYQHFELLKDFLLEDAARWRDNSRRTEFMVNNLLWFLQNRGIQKTFIWAHNGHINKMEGAQDILQRQGSFGNFLSSNFGHNYYCIGIYTATGRYSAFRSERNETWEAFALEKPNKYTIEFYLALADAPEFFLDLSKTFTRPPPLVLQQNILQRSIGMFHDQSQFYNIGPPAELYDGIYFVRESTNTTRPAN